MIFDVIIVGSGLAGSYLARKLHLRGFNTLIIEKSKSIGGRLSTKPVGSGLADYGCQYLIPKTEQLSTLIQELETKKIIKKSNLFKNKSSYIAPYGMNKIPQYLSLGIKTLLNQKVESLKRTRTNWEIITDSFSLRSKALALTMPINQVVELLQLNDSELKKLPMSKYKSFFTITLQSENQINRKVVSSIKNAPWICNNLLKGIENKKNIYTINLSQEFSDSLLDLKNSEKDKILKDFLLNIGFENHSHSRLHFWKYAFSEDQNNTTNYFDKNKMLGLCGDSFSVGQANGAIVSAERTFKDISHII